MKKYYRFNEKVLSFLRKDTIVFMKRYYRFYEKILSFFMKDSIGLK